MLNSILNITSSQQQESTEVSASSIQSQHQHSFESSQNFTASNGDFAHQLNQFRQLLQGSLGGTGKRLPEFEHLNINSSHNLMAEKLSQLQLMINQFGQIAEGLLLETGSNMAPSDGAEQSVNTNLQLLIDSISENLNHLNSINAEQQLALTDQQVSKLSQAIEVLQTKLDKVNLVLADTNQLSVDPELLQKAVAELLSDSTKAMQRVNQALQSSGSQTNNSIAHSLATESEKSKFTFGSDDIMISRDSKKSASESAQQFATTSFKDFAKGERLNAENLSKVGEPLANSKPNNVEVKANSGILFSETSFPKGAEAALLSEKGEKLGSNILKPSDSLLSNGKAMVMGSIPLDVKTLQNLSSITANPSEPSPSISQTVQEVTSGQNIQSTQISSQSNIQQGLSLRNDFTPNLALRIQWIFQQALSSAEIMMDPPELGPLTVKMQHRAGETSIVFQVNNPQTKEMLEENLPKLKEMLQEQGIALGDTQVNQNHQQEDQKDPENSKVAIDEEPLDNNKLVAKNNVSDSEQVALLDAYI